MSPKSKDKIEDQYKGITLKDIIKIYEDDPSKIELVKYKKLFMKTLHEIDEDVIGHEKLKRTIAQQVSLLVRGLSKTQKSKPMLNIILYGDPGVGKTMIGTKLAKLMFSTGYLDGSTMADNINNFIEDETYWTYFTILIFYIIVFYFSTAFDLISKGLWTPLLITTVSLVVIFLLIYVIYIYLTKNDTSSKDKPKTKEEMDAFKTEDENYINTLKDSDVVKVVSREDFVSKYLGGTASQTLNLLRANIGKCLFIDECYSLAGNNEGDPYGKEAVDTLNKFLSENPDKIIVVFAGYKQQMKRTIFAVQPGLESRCMWKFSCDNYTADDLFNILMNKVKADKMSVPYKDQQNLRSLIEKQRKTFKAQGRDMEKLMNFAKIQQNNDLLNNRITDDELLLYRHFLNGHKEFVENMNDFDSNSVDDKDFMERRDIAKLINSLRHDL